MEPVRLSLVVPCYNEQEPLPVFFREATDVISRMGISYELLLVNDGSSDGTIEIIRELARKDPCVAYLTFSRNFGKEAAMYAGLKNARGEYVAVMDADMQDPPSLLPQMVEILDGGEYDSVATRRATRQGESPVRSWFARLFYRVINRISDADIVDGARDFRLMRREMVDAIVALGEENRFSKGIYGWIGFRTYWLSFENVQRVAGETKWSFWGLAKYAVDGIVNFSEMPLSIASWFGVAMTALAFLATVVVAARRLFFGDPVAGWASIMCVIVFIGGVQLLCLGIIGQYLAKAYTEVKRRPHYIVSESSRGDVERIG